MHNVASKDIDQDHLIDVERHKKIYGIAPDNFSENYLKKTIDKLKSKEERYRRQTTNIQIKKLEHELDFGCETKKLKEQEAVIRYKLMNSAKFDMVKDFDQRIGRMSQLHQSSEERRRL